MRGVRLVIFASVTSDLLPFVVIGTVAGALYGLAATGLVLTYKTSGIFNFAHGAIGAFSAYCFYDLRDVQRLPAWLAFVLAVGVAAPLLGGVLSVVAARLEHASTARRVVATIGVLLAIQGGLQLRYGIPVIGLRTSFPSSTFELADVRIGYDQLITTVIALAAVAGLALLFRFSALGLRMRAVVDNSELLGLDGDHPQAVRAWSWAIGAAFAGLSGVLLAPTVGLDALVLTLVVVQAFGAAAVGRFRSTTGAFVGGLAIGIVAAVLKAPILVRNLGVLRDLPSLDDSLPFLVLFGVLLLSRRGEFQDRAVPREAREVPSLPWRVTGPIGLLVVAAVAVLPHLYETRVPVFTLGAVFVVVFASLHLLVEVSNQVSLCHVAFVAIGATTFAHVTTGAGLPWGVGVALAAAVAVPVGALVAIPAIRLSGLFLALATLGFGILVERLAYPRGVMFGAIGQRSGARPAVLGLDGGNGYFYLCALLAALAIGVVVAIRRARLGRLLNALADSPVALATHGTTTSVTRVLVFCISAAMAGLAGALYVGVTGSVSSSGVSSAALVSFNSLLWLAVLSFVGRSAVVAPVLAAIALVVAPAYVTNPDIVQYQTLLFGLLALGVAAFGPDLARVLRTNAERDGRRLARSPVAARTRGRAGPRPEVAADA
jgi:branched-subunit amino acid ABC-type transport system permease component